ncbi:MAG: ion channel [Calothrix sp. MO_167.B42]|nr:ion channel [Calothrix sp. MO_167.B42]
MQIIWRFLQRENFDRLLLIMAIMITTSSLALSRVEPNLSLFDAIWWSIVTLTTVGYGDIAPVTIFGRFIATVDMFLGIGILATFTAQIASILVEKKNMEYLGMSNYKFTEHIILCEWNSRAKAIVDELRLDESTQEKPVVLIAEIDRKPIDDRNLFFIQGNVCDETLERANLVAASTVIILGDDNLDDTARDAKVILSTLTVESINTHAYIIVELFNESHFQTCKRAKADEIIVSSELSSMLISQAVLNHGISKVVSDLLTAHRGNQLYKIPIPQSQIGKTFMDVFVYMKQSYQSIAVAIEKEPEGEVISNPPADYPLREKDYLIVIAKKRPKITD